MDGQEFVSSARRYQDIDLHLKEALTADLKLGIPFIDEYLLGILPKDFVLIGAKSGKGKTQFLLEIAKYNAMSGKKVAFIALEAEKDEIEMRLKYQLLSNLYFNDEDRDRTARIDYRAWRLGRCKTLEKYENRCWEMFRARYSTLITVYRASSYTIDDFERQMVDLARFNPSMIILDHLHYFDIKEGVSNENSYVGRIVKKIRELIETYKIPVIAAAHVRKDIHSLIPEMEDYMGTSDLYKVPTVEIMFAPKPDSYDAKNAVAPTLITVVKSRTGGMGGMCAEMYFSLKHQSYSPLWKLGRVYSRGEKFELLNEEDYPEWAKNKDLRINPEKNTTEYLDPTK